MFNRDAKSIHAKFEALITKILKRNSYEVQNQTALKQHFSTYRPDLIASKDGEEYIIEVKFYRYQGDGKKLLNQAIQDLLLLGSEPDTPSGISNIKKVIITSIEVPKEMHNRDIQVWDIKHLHELARKDYWVLMELEDFIQEHSLVFDSNQFITIDMTYEEAIETAPIEPIKEGAELIKRIETIKPGTAGWQKFEVVCFDALKYLFDGELSGWHKQAYTEDGLNRYDLICRINSSVDKDSLHFWTELSSDCNTRYIIFESKNYEKPIKQGQIYTTEKYLFSRALRTVAFILTRKGADDNAHQATLGILRESGKIVIVLDQNDLFDMLNLKDENLEPSEVLRAKLDNLLITLSK